MSLYKIEIVAEDDGALTTLRVEATPKGLRILELAVRAGDSGGVRPNRMHAIDPELLLQALLPGADVSGPVRPRSEGTALPTTGGFFTDSEAPAKSKRTLRGAAGSSVRRGAGSRDSARVKGATAGRVYRRMPGDVVAVYERAGTVTGVAEHYQVPRHTAQGWIGRLRRQGILPTAP